MGIPLYFKQLSEKYPNIIVDTINNSVDGDSKSNKNNLFLDLNCAIHPCCRKVLEEHSHSNNNKSAVEIWANEGVDKAIEHMCKHPETGDPMDYATMRNHYG